MDSSTVVLIIITAVCFGVGFGLSWMQARKRVIKRYEEAVQKELQRRVAEEVLKRVAQGPELGDTIRRAADAEARKASQENT